ncbi:hypothetical protein ABZX85_15045 [Streptomyces sp. NPDC004539]|uniref:AMIN-like domain-containing (lipo)protein n=1 Tax=Streptomyces sp. NPDC004539 TaxID=3154280 RepID=UPI0033AEB592
MYRWATALAALTLTLTGAVLAPSAAAAPRAAACETGWGSGAKAAPGSIDMTGTLTDVRTGRHDCYDRIVLDIPGMTTADPAAYWVQYVPSFSHPPTQTGIPVTGGAIIEIEFTAPPSPAYPARLAARLPGVDLTGYRTFRDAKFGGNYDNATHLGLGTRAQLPFRVLTLPDRLVVDVAHTW